VNRAINIVQDSIKQQPGQKSSTRGNEYPIVVRLDGLAQINDMLAIREMGRQIAEQEGQEEADDEEETDLAVDVSNSRHGKVVILMLIKLAWNKASAPTTLPSHLLTYLTASSSRSIIVVIEGFDLFTEHARQALLYCLCESMVWKLGGLLTDSDCSGCRSERQDWSGGKYRQRCSNYWRD
jgi:hypothetical protein